jgi:apoptosis-inducing factor 2
MTKTIVILGAGLAGLPVAHYLLSRTAVTHKDIRVVLVNPSDTFYWNLASPRIVLPGQLVEDKYMWSIPDLFAKYPSDKFEFVAGKADTLSPEDNSVVVRQADGSTRTIAYHTVIVATGADAREKMPWKPLGSSAETREAIARLQGAIEKAKSIVVAGGGVTGVELAGELGAAYAKSGLKQVTLIVSDSLPLERRIMKRTREAALRQLQGLGVKVLIDSRVATISPGTGSKQMLEISKSGGNKATLETDLFIPTYGVVINTQFAPASMKDAEGRLAQDSRLRAPGYDNIFVLGDAGNLQPMQGINVEGQVRHLTKQFNTYLRGDAVAEYKFDRSKIMMGVSVGPSGGTGQFGSIKPFSFFISIVRGQLGTNYSKDYAAGVRTLFGKW